MKGICRGLVGHDEHFSQSLLERTYVGRYTSFNTSRRQTNHYQSSSSDAEAVTDWVWLGAMLSLVPLSGMVWDYGKGLVRTGYRMDVSHPAIRYPRRECGRKCGT